MDDMGPPLCIEANLWKVPHVTLIVDDHGRRPRTIGFATDISEALGLSVAIDDMSCTVGSHRHIGPSAPIWTGTTHAAADTGWISVNDRIGWHPIDEGDNWGFLRGIFDIDEVSEDGVISGEYRCAVDKPHAGLCACSD